MADRALRRLGLHPVLLHKLQSQNLTSAKDILLTNPLELVERLDVDAGAVTVLLETVSASVLPEPVTALQLLQRPKPNGSHLTTHLPAFDKGLKGGIPVGSITELVGPAGVGKSQMCLLLTIAALRGPIFMTPPPPASVLYIDTERKFASRRLEQMAGARWPGIFKAQEAISALVKRIVVATPSTSAELLALLQGLESVVIEQAVRLIIIDSIAMLARAEFGGQQMQDRQSHLGQQASALKHIAESFQIPVVVTNQVTSASQVEGPRVAFTDPSTPHAAGEASSASNLMASLGPMWSHAVNTRIIMESAADMRYIKVAKSPTAPNLAFAYNITAAGIELQEGSAPTATGNLMQQRIAHDMLYEPQGA